MSSVLIVFSRGQHLHSSRIQNSTILAKRMQYYLVVSRRSRFKNVNILSNEVRLDVQFYVN